MADFSNNNNIAQAARVTANRDIVTLPSYYKWLAQGKIFEAGQGLQTVGIDSQGETTLTPDDVKATCALVAPSGATTLVIPLLFKVMFEVEGGAATDFQLIFTKAASECATALTLSGRDMAASQCMYSANPVKASPSASPLYGVATTFLLTVSALTDADNVMTDFTAMSDNNVSAALGTVAVQQKTYNFMDTIPHILTSGAAMIFYISSATSDAVIHPYMQWAELTIDDLL
jgi:hypothetical protein